MANTADPELTQTIEGVGSTPGGIGTPPVPGTAVTIRAAANREYTAGSVLQWFQNLPHSLTWAIDDIAVAFGADVFQRMLLDPQCRSVIEVYKAGILETGVQFTSAIDDKDEDGYDQAAALVDRVERMLDDLTVSLDDVLWDMGDACALGNRMAEQVYALDTTHTDRQEYVLQTLAVKPMESAAFVVDAYQNVLGILGRIPGQPFGVQQGLLLTDIEHTPNLLPRSKFAVLTFRPRNGDPRGTSLLRPAFSTWNAKVELLREWLKYLTQFATPSLIGFTAEGAQPYPALNADGTPKEDSYGNPIYQTPEEAMLAALTAFANGTATAFPHGSLVQAVEMSGQGEAFLNAINLFDRQIAKAVLGQTLATEEGEHQTRAASGTHKDILDTLTRQGKRPVERMLTKDVLTTWLRLNGEDNLIDLLPKVSLGTSEQEDLAKMRTAVAALYRSNYLHSSQFAGLDAELGLPERTPPDATSASVTEVVNVKGTGVEEPIEGTETPPAPEDGSAGPEGTGDEPTA